MQIRTEKLRIGSVAILSVVLFACSSTAPIAQIKDADVKEVEWKTCVGKDAPEAPFECGFVDAPVDYYHPEGDRVSVALIRLPSDSSSNRRGVILTNPGGPGGSGFDFVVSSGKDLVSELSLAEFDIVGFDPRGVDRSGGLRCYTDAEMDKFLYIDRTPDNKDEQALFDEYEKDTSTCEDRLGKFIKFYSTENTARDMDLIRAGMRVDTIHFLGISYGTYLGGVYATLFPDRVASMVLDGAYDPQGDTVEEESTTQAIGFEKAFNNWVTWCETDSDCEFQGDDVAAKWGSLYDRLDKISAKTSKGRMINHKVMMTATRSMLYAQSNWTALGSALQQAQDGKPDLLLVFADVYNSRQDDGIYLTSNDSQYLIHCASGFEKNLPKDPEALVRKIKEVAPWYSQGIDVSYFDEPGCEDIFKGIKIFEIAYNGRSPIVVIGGENDPATPFRWSQEMVANMGTNASLVKFTGEGHSQIFNSKCVDAIASNTFRKLEILKSEVMCDADKPVPQPTWWSEIPPAALPGEKLNSKSLSPLTGFKETDDYAEFRAIPGNIEIVFSQIYKEFKASDYETDCDPQLAPLKGPCFFWKAKSENIGLVVYTEQEVKEFELVIPDGPVPSGMNLMIYFYRP
jgi:pimeloyl-ACP methyl ester carboxylesterase